MPRSKGSIFWPVMAVIVAADALTKQWAITELPRYVPQPVIGEWLRWTLVYNPGAAFGINFGEPGYSRWIFMALTLTALGILSRLYASSQHGQTVRIVSLACVCAGAVGNLIDRAVRQVDATQGVVDFIDVGVHAYRWPTFNIADMAVSIGAILLARVLWNEDRIPVPPSPEPLAVLGGAPATMVLSQDTGDRG